MPTVSVGRDLLFQTLGQTYTQEEFENLCFEFGIELDDVTTEKAIIRKEKHLEGEEDSGDEEVIYKIEVPANRYDLLCVEGIARALRIFTGKEEPPTFRCVDIPSKYMLKMHVKPETISIRPFIMCAVLRGVTFSEASYKSFIDLQDKLHQNICRKRTLVAIGTHDLDTIQGPFSYEALPPPEITFVPLKQVKSFRADELLEYYKSDLKLKKFLHIIEDSPVYPVIYDSNRTVLSLPPIINGAHSAISLKTKNVFIECTATDLTKAKVVLNTVITMFSEYCEQKYEAEPVEVVYPDERTLEVESFEGTQCQANIYPDLSITNFVVPISEITDPIGITLNATEVITLLRKMQLRAEESSAGEKCQLIVSVPPTRSDILHACDIMEDVAIAFGYNNIPTSVPKTVTRGGQQPLNKFSDMIRQEVCGAGYMEVLTWILVSHEENFPMVKREDNGRNAVIISNPRSSDFEVVRTSLLSGLLKTLKHNIDHPKPVKIFEVGDVVTLDGECDVGASNNRRLAALYCDSEVSAFEDIVGLAARILKRAAKDNHLRPSDEREFLPKDNHFRPSDEPEFLPKRQCSICIKEKQIGIFGIVHPEVLKNFGIGYPCSYVEIDIQALMQSWLNMLWL